MKKKNQYYDIDENFARFSKRATKILTLSIISFGVFLISFCLFAKVIFKEPRFDKYTSVIVSQFLWWDAAMLITFSVITVFLAILIFRTVKEKDNPKWAHIIWIVCAVICVFQVKNVSEVVLDITNESYVVYQGEFTQDNGGYSARFRSQTTRLMPEDIRLKSRSSLIDSGDYVGTVVYTERSRIALEVKDADSK
ncbi:MAG: hypothetical protein E7586_01120 [Ruminococcaceae bacterium]|nr:hypothetical protein [Oscillospiraceae bacterium]